MTCRGGTGYNHAMTRKLESTGERAVTQLNIEREAPAVKRFFETLTLTPGGSEFDMNGKHVVINVVPEAEKWTPAKEARRLELIEREIAGTITRNEGYELELLQDELQAHVELTAPLPMDYGRKLYRDLLAKARAAGEA